MAKKDMKKHEAYEIPEESLEKVSGGMTEEEAAGVAMGAVQAALAAFQQGKIAGMEIGYKHGHEQGLKDAIADIKDGPDNL